MLCDLVEGMNVVIGEVLVDYDEFEWQVFACDCEIENDFIKDL